MPLALQTNAGATNYIRITMPNSDYTVSFWQLIGGSGVNQTVSIADAPNFSIPNFMFNITANNGTTASYNAYMAGSYVTPTQTGYVVAQWNHIVITKTATQHKLYVNGTLIYTTASLYGPIYLYLGNAFSTYTDTKSFDNVRVYQRAITQSEVTEIFNAGR